MLVVGRFTKSHSYDFPLKPIFSEFWDNDQNFKLTIFVIFYLSALSAVLDEINTRNYATLCKIGNKMGFIPFKISVRRLVFREIEIRKIFRMDITRKILLSQRNLLKQNSLESHSTSLLLSKSLRETNIFRVLSIRKIIRISISRKPKRLTEFLPGMNTILFSTYIMWHNFVYLSRLQPQIK